MSGYLQRMAASALSRERAIHPVLGSLWIPQRGADSFEISSETAAARMEPSRNRDRNIERVQTPFRARPEAERPIQAESTRAEDEPPRAVRAAEPTPRIGAEEAMPMQHESEGQPLRADSKLPLIAAPAAGEVSLRAERSEPPPRIFVPLVSESSQQPAAAQKIAAQAAASPRASALRPQPSAQPAREPDAIEIHIGRIEVLAAQPQPAPRPPARPSRKSLDLAEYLRRGGRSR